MEQGLTVSIVANFVLIGGFIVYGFGLFAAYHSTGRWAKNITAFLAGLGMLFLALALILRPANAAVIERIAETGASEVLLWVSTAMLLAAIAAFGIITYSKPLRLLHERQLQRDLNSELPKIP